MMSRAWSQGTESSTIAATGLALLPFLGAAILILFGRKWSRDTVVAVAVRSALASSKRRRSKSSRTNARITRTPESVSRIT